MASEIRAATTVEGISFWLRADAKGGTSHAEAARVQWCRIQALRLAIASLSCPTPLPLKTMGTRIALAIRRVFLARP